MRHELQQRNKIRVSLEVVSAGAGVTGLSPTVVLKRVSDDMYWDGADWQVTSSTNAMAEVDVTDQPGLYLFELDSSGFDATLGADGYEAVIVEGTQPIRQNLRIEVYEEVTTGDPVAFTAVPTEFNVTEAVQAGTTRRLSFSFTSDPLALGASMACHFHEIRLTVGSTVYDLVADAVVQSQFVESGRGTGNEAAVTGTPIFGFAFPIAYSILSVPVDNSAVFAIGDYVRAKDHEAGTGSIFSILDIPDGTTLHLFAKNAPGHVAHINDGDTVESVQPSGKYTGYFDLPIDTYLSVAEPIASLTVVAETEVLGLTPGFPAVVSALWERTLQLDVAGRGFRAG